MNIKEKTTFFKKLYIDKSDINGIGLFSDELIDIGDKILVFGGTIFNDIDISNNLVDPKTTIAISETKWLGNRLNSPKDLDDYINHSCQPNTWMIDEVTLVASKKILPKEEITADYAIWLNDNSYLLTEECNCNATLCRKKISGTDWMRLDVIKSLQGHFSPFINDRVRILLNNIFIKSNFSLNIENILGCKSKEKIIDQIEAMHTQNFDIFDEIVINDNIKFLRKTYSKLLYDREVSYSKKLTNLQDIQKFYKWEIYKLRCDFELLCAENVLGRKVRNIIFVGAGAMPISAIVASQKNIDVTAIDIDFAAFSSGANICKLMNLNIDYQHKDLFNYKNYHKHDLVIIAGSVGTCEKDKENIIKHISNNISKDSTICIRAPIREEKLLMASINLINSLKRTSFLMENEVDYILRIFFQLR